MNTPRRLLLILFCAVGPAAVYAAPSPDSLAAAAAHRFPQPVRVGDLLGRSVLQPTESQDVLGHVRGVAREADGALLVVMSFGGLLGVGTRLIAVPVDAVVLVGDVVQVVGLKPAELRALPAYDGRASPLGPNEVIRVGLAKPVPLGAGPGRRCGIEQNWRCHHPVPRNVFTF